MPIYDPRNRFERLDLSEYSQDRTEQIPEDVSALDSLSASASRLPTWGTLGKMARRSDFNARGLPEEGWRPFPGLRNLLNDRSKKIDIFRDDRYLLDEYNVEVSEDTMDELRDIDTLGDLEFYLEEREYQNKLREQTTWWSDLVSEVVEPSNYIPVAGSSAAVARLSTKQLAGRIAAITALQETVMQHNEYDRAALESISAVAGSIAVPVIARSIIRRIYQGKPVTNGTIDRETDALIKDIEDGNAPWLDDSVGASRTTPEELAKAVDADDSQVVGGGRGFLKFLEPVSRRLRNSQFESVRNAGRLIQQSSTYTKAEIEGEVAELALSSRMKEHHVKLRAFERTVNDVVKKVRKASSEAGKKLTRTEILTRASRVMDSGVADDIDEINNLADLGRQIYDEYGLALQNEGLLDGEAGATFLENYLTRKANKEAIEDNFDEFKGLLENRFRQKGKSAAEAEELAHSVAKNFLSGGNWDILKPRAGKISSNRLKDRHILDDLVDGPEFEKFFERDLSKLIRSYILSVAPTLEIKRMGFESGSISKHFEPLIAAEKAEALAKATTKKQKDKIRKDARRELQQIRDLELNVTGQRIFEDDYNSFWQRFGRGVRMANYMTMLGQVPLTSATDLGMLVSEFGPLKSTKMLFKSLRAITSSEFRKYSKEQLERLDALIDLTTNERAMATWDIDGFIGGDSPVLEGLATGARWFSKVILFDKWNAAMKSLAAFNAIDDLAQISLRVSKGTASPEDLAQLAHQSISVDMAKKISKAINKGLRSGDRSSQVYKGILIPDTSTWDPDVRLHYESAIRNRINTTIITPDAGDKVHGGLINTNRALDQLILQFSSFTIASRDKSVARSIQRSAALGKTPQVLVGFAVAVGMAAIANDIKASLGGRESPPVDSLEFWQAAVDRSGKIPMLDLINRLNSAAGNLPFKHLGIDYNGRYWRSSNWFTAFGGPTANRVFSGGELIKDVLEDGDIDNTKQVLEQLPGQNAWTLRLAYKTFFDIDLQEEDINAED